MEIKDETRSAAYIYLIDIENRKTQVLDDRSVTDMLTLEPVVQRWLARTDDAQAGKVFKEWLAKHDDSPGYARYRLKNQELTDTNGRMDARLCFDELDGMRECIAEWNDDVTAKIQAYRYALRNLKQAMKRVEFEIRTAETVDQVREALAEAEAYNV